MAMTSAYTSTMAPPIGERAHVGATPAQSSYPVSSQMPTQTGYPVSSQMPANFAYPMSSQQPVNIAQSKLAGLLRERVLIASVGGPSVAGVIAMFCGLFSVDGWLTHLAWCLFAVAPGCLTLLAATGIFASMFWAFAWAVAILSMLSMAIGVTIDALLTPTVAAGCAIALLPVCLYFLSSGLGQWVWHLAWMSQTLGMISICCSIFMDDWPIHWQLALATLSMGPAQLLRAFALVQRGVGLEFPSPRGCSLCLLAVLVTAWSTCLIVASLGGGDATDSQGFGCLVGIVALRQFWSKSVLHWSSIPIDLRLQKTWLPRALPRVLTQTYFPTHPTEESEAKENVERIEDSAFLTQILAAFLWTVLCVLAAAWFLDGSAVFSAMALARALAGTLVFYLGSRQVDAIQAVTSFSLSFGEYPRGYELAEAFVEPLSAHGPGLGRWVAMTALTHAAHGVTDILSLQPQADSTGRPWEVAPASSAREKLYLPVLVSEIFSPDPISPAVKAAQFATLAPYLAFSGAAPTPSNAQQMQRSGQVFGFGGLRRGFIGADANASSLLEGRQPNLLQHGGVGKDLASPVLGNPYLPGAGASAVPGSASILGSGSPQAPVLEGSLIESEKARTAIVNGMTVSFPTVSGMFALYLQSGLEILRECSVRLHCLAEAPRRRGAAALMPEQLAGRYVGLRDTLFYLEALHVRSVELLPLGRISATGLSSWICFSQRLDSIGVVQRENALPKVIHELCGLLSAIDAVLCLSGALHLPRNFMQIIEESQVEIKGSLANLLRAFEGKGLNLVKLPPRYNRLLATLFPE